MPPASMVDNPMNDLDPFNQFGQLSINNINQAPSPATPPSAPKQDNMTTSNPMMVPGMNNTNTGGYQHHPSYQQQPMQITPDQASSNTTNPTGALVYQHQPPQAASYANYQFSPPQMNNNPNASLYQQPVAMPPQPTAQALTSPPISPLWNPTSPGQTPPTDGSANKIMHQTAPTQGGVGMLPSLPTGFGEPASTAVPGQAANNGVAPVPTLSPSVAPTTVANPFDMFAPSPQAAPTVPTDPFANNTAIAPPAATAPQQQQNNDNDDDFWNDMGFGTPGNSNTEASPSNNNNSPGNVTPTHHHHHSDNSFSSVTSEDDNSSNQYHHHQDHSSQDDTPVSLDDRGLPVGGEYYNARVTTPMLGAIFSSGYELRSTLFKNVSNSFVESIGDRPVISFTIDGSAADTAGIGLGHVLLKVNGTEVTHTDDAVKMVGEASRPMTMEFYIPNKNVRVVKTEGQCMVKYDNQSTDAPASACEWKPKYVVVGDMLGKPHILYMYRSKVSSSKWLNICFSFFASLWDLLSLTSFIANFNLILLYTLMLKST